jgi:HTH-type transcriptional regulator/antitoxin HigA
MVMKIKLIRTEEEYKAALAYLEELGDREGFEQNKELVEEFELLAALVEMYDKEHFPLQSGDPIEIILLRMEYKGLKRKDLSEIATSGVLSEVFNKKRGLSKQMIRKFSELLNIDQELLNTSYTLNEAAPVNERVKMKSPFKFIKTNRPNLIRFKKRIAEHRMLLNVCNI